MQDTPIHCPADAEASEAEKLACDAPKPSKPGGVTAQDSGGGGGSEPPPKPPIKQS